ncbi:MAG: AAA family ATPase, partial [Myxococcaceae bacterium]
MKHLSDFEVRSFRNVRPTKLEFRPGLNVVLGKNAAGKTSLLKLLAGSLSGISPDPLQEERAVELRLVDADASLGQSVA